MTRFDRVEPRLSELLTDLAAPGLPDYTEDVLARTAGLRQRPRWTLLERWLPMGVLAQRSVYIPRVPWRAVIVTALLLVIVAATLAWVGSQRRAAPPFGPARNGLIMYAVDGDLFSWDPTRVPVVRSSKVRPTTSRASTRATGRSSPSSAVSVRRPTRSPS